MIGARGRWSRRDNVSRCTSMQRSVAGDVERVSLPVCTSAISSARCECTAQHADGDGAGAGGEPSADDGPRWLALRWY